MELHNLIPHTCHHKTVLVRVDFNVPLEKKGTGWIVTDDSRIKAALPTLNLLVQHEAKVVLLSHLGRPEGKPNAKESLVPVAKHLEQLLGKRVLFVPTCVGPEAETAIATLQPGEIAILENVRFHPEEEKNELSFAKKLSQLGEIFINEAFSTCHRAHASVVGITKYLPSFAGLALAEEVRNLNDLMTSPKRPFVMVIGGAKISDKVGAVQHLAKIADAVLVGGGTANNFLKAEGIDIYKSLAEDTSSDSSKRRINYIDVAEEMIESTRTEKLLLDGYIPLPKIIMPIDVVAATSPKHNNTQIVELVNGNHQEAQSKNLMYLDIGPKTIKLFKEVILQAGTIFWNGPMGVFEEKLFEDGTREIAKAIAKSSATTILGGGDTIAAINQFKLSDRFDYISAAGGAALEFLSGEKLPGIKPLLKKD